MNLDYATLEKYASPDVLDKGQLYYDHGLVRDFQCLPDKLIGTVNGTQAYTVKLWFKNERLNYDCSCPVGQNGIFCKHAVALGLAWMAVPPHADTLAATDLSYDKVHTWLNKQPKEKLVNWLWDHLVQNDHMYQMFLLRMANSEKTKIEVNAYCQALDDTIYTDQFVSYLQAPEYGAKINAVVSTFKELIDDGHASEAIEIIEYAFQRVEAAISHVDEAGYCLESILDYLQKLHHQACAKAQLAPEDLAKRLLHLELTSEVSTFENAVLLYADLLGDTGLALYQKLATVEWEKALALSSDSSSEYDRQRITSIMETIAKQNDDIEALVAIKEQTLFHPCHYLQIAEIYQAAKHYDKALAWAERGLAQFPNESNCSLRDFIAAEYQRRGWHEKALEQVWTIFSTATILKRYQQLKSYAELIDQWPSWRTKALEHIHQQIEQANQKTKKMPLYYRTDHSLLVDIFLWENKVIEAWQEAQHGGCSTGLWLTLAEKLAPDHPQDAIAIYQAQISPIIDLKDYGAYTNAIGLLKKIQPLMQKLNQTDEFRQYITSLRANHKAKRNFIKLLNQEGW